MKKYIKIITCFILIISITILTGLKFPSKVNADDYRKIVAFGSSIVSGSATEFYSWVDNLGVNVVNLAAGGQSAAGETFHAPISTGYFNITGLDANQNPDWSYYPNLDITVHNLKDGGSLGGPNVIGDIRQGWNGASHVIVEYGINDTYQLSYYIWQYWKNSGEPNLDNLISNDLESIIVHAIGQVKGPDNFVIEEYENIRESLYNGYSLDKKIQDNSGYLTYAAGLEYMLNKLYKENSYTQNGGKLNVILLSDNVTTIDWVNAIDAYGYKFNGNAGNLNKFLYFAKAYLKAIMADMVDKYGNCINMYFIDIENVCPNVSNMLKTDQVHPTIDGQNELAYCVKNSIKSSPVSSMWNFIN